MDSLAYYRSQSHYSAPGDYAACFDALPDDLDRLCQTVRNVYMHYRVAQEPDSGVPPDNLAMADTRYIHDILAHIMALSPSALTTPRPPEKRFIGCCRDAALLLCAMLRHKGIPARIRAGFAAYIDIGSPGFHIDHVVTEFWDASAERWKLIDPEQDSVLIAQNHIDFDTHDVPRDRFLVGGSVWQQWRAGKIDGSAFGIAPDKDWSGEWIIRNRLLHDLVMLNKTELLLWDSWGWLEVEPEGEAVDQALLATAAALTTADSLDLNAIQSLYADARLRAPSQVMRYSPVSRPVRVRLSA